MLPPKCSHCSSSSDKRLAHITVAVCSDHSDGRPPRRQQRVCLVLGAGSGVGQAVARRFASEGYHVVCVRRGGSGDNQGSVSRQELHSFVQSVRAENGGGGGSAQAFFADGAAPAQIEALVEHIEAEVGAIHAAVFNIGTGGEATDEKHRGLGVAEVTHEAFEAAWHKGARGPFALAKALAPHMLARGHGTILFTGATAGFRGSAGQIAHTAAMAARRMLAQSLNHELGPQGIHICHINIDGTIDAPESIGKLMPEFYRHMKASQQHGEPTLLIPSSVASTYWHLHTQVCCRNGSYVHSDHYVFLSSS
jgi:NAD(P)-dependent dehydrogenase (short-subunit alcohol dehydrogenase family)